MEPIQLGPFTVYPFGLFFALLLIPFFIFVSFQMKRVGLKKGTASWYALLAVPLCFIFARLGFCLLVLDQIVGAEGISLIFRLDWGGFLLWGAIGGALLAAKIAGRITGQSGAKIADATVLPVCLMIAAIRLLCGFLFKNMGTGLPLDYWFDPEETDFTFRYSVWPLEDYSFFERFPFAVAGSSGVWKWAVFVPQAIWACLTGFLSGRPRTADGGRTARFVILFACGSIVLESMLYSGEIMHLPWLAFVKANQILCAVALLSVLLVCLHRLPKGQRLKPALITFPQFLAAIGIIIVLEFAVFEKKIPQIEWLPSDACHLLMALACLWIALSFRPVWKKAYAAESPAAEAR